MSFHPNIVMPRKDKLLPCPFCGGTDFNIGHEECTDKPDYWIECKKCDCLVERDSQIKVIKAWNTRASEVRNEKNFVD